MQRKIRSVVLNNYMGDKEENPTPSPKKSKKSDKQQNASQGLDPIIEKVIKDALMIHILNANENKKRVANELDAMVATCQEFMSSFIILGYDMNGNPVHPIVFAHNQQEADALGSYMSKFINHSIKEIEPNEE